MTDLAFGKLRRAECIWRSLLVPFLTVVAAHGLRAQVKPPAIQRQFDGFDGIPCGTSAHSLKSRMEYVQGSRVLLDTIIGDTESLQFLGGMYLEHDVESWKFELYRDELKRIRVQFTGDVEQRLGLYEDLSSELTIEYGEAGYETGEAQRQIAYRKSLTDADISREAEAGRMFFYRSWGRKDEFSLQCTIESALVLRFFCH